MMNASKVSQGSFVRRAALRNPAISLKDLQAQWKAEKMGGSPPDMQILYSARSTLKKKYGLTSFDQITFKMNGDVNVSNLLRHLIKKRPNITPKQASLCLRQDGLSYVSSLFAMIKNKLVLPQESPDKNQHRGPRARFKPKAKINKQVKEQDDLGITEEQRVKGESYLEVSNAIESLMEKAKKLEDSELVEKMRQACNHCLHTTYHLFD